MAFWNRYPYTNFHEINLDWILEKIKELMKSNEDLKAAVADVKTLVSGEVAEYIDKLLADGTLEQIINEQVFTELNTKVDANTSGLAEVKTTAETSAERLGKMPVVYVTEYGAVGDGVTDDTVAINRALANAKGYVYFPRGTYLVSAGGDYYASAENMGLIVKSNTVVDLGGSVIKLAPNAYEKQIIFNINDAENVVLKNGTIQGDSDAHTFGGSTTHEWGYGVSVRKSKNVHLTNLVVKNMTGDGIYIGQNITYNNNDNVHNYNIVVDNVAVDTVGRNGITVGECVGWSIRDCSFSNITRTEPKAAIDFEKEGDYSPVLGEGTIENIVVSNCNKGIKLTNAGIVCHVKNMQVNSVSFGVLINQDSIGDLYNVSNIVQLDKGAKATIANSTISLWAYENTPEVKAVDCDITMGATCALGKSEMFRSVLREFALADGLVFWVDCDIYSTGNTMVYFRANAFVNGCRVHRKAQNNLAFSCAGGVEASVINCKVYNEDGGTASGALTYFNDNAVVNGNTYTSFTSAAQGTLASGCVNFA